MVTVTTVSLLITPKVMSMVVETKGRQFEVEAILPFTRCSGMCVCTPKAMSARGTLVSGGIDRFWGRGLQNSNGTLNRYPQNCSSNQQIQSYRGDNRSQRRDDLDIAPAAIALFGAFETTVNHPPSMRDHKGDILSTVFELIDAVVEIYLGSVVKPFVKFHESFYSALNVVLRKLLDENAIPEWFTANFVTYFRTILVIPTVLLLAWEYWVMAAVICIIVDLGDFLDGVVARYWVDMRKKRATEGESKDKHRSTSPTNSDDDSFGTFGSVSSGDRQLLPLNGPLPAHRGRDDWIAAFCTFVGEYPSQ